VVGDLKPEVLEQMSADCHDGGGAAAVCRDLSHLYHYYLHGLRGNVPE
jgi:hypothetical protein